MVVVVMVWSAGLRDGVGVVLKNGHGGDDIPCGNIVW